MTGRPFRVDWDPKDTPVALKTACRVGTEQGVMLRATARAVAAAFGTTNGQGGVGSRSPLTDAAEVGVLVQSRRVKEVLTHRMRGLGQPRFLSAEQERELTEEVGSGQFRTGAEIREFIESEYRVSFRPGSLYAPLSRLECSPRAHR